ncbi:fasciclin domain-containing protein [Methanobacterium paludis]|uniref:Beta-Ig-H3/fasciclin n=1 Tax=Methanobacterium paludis (strain DSM 25820 / JCM 18151 / SWAN1) TaxID=868131 RepID=F6D1P3_METPW|nr:fasciclin domain-containing protein [Methanobacterium paludis]AEG17846.1 beta-Ig-H3/fasciclin [Methanobacterium paludis]
MKNIVETGIEMGQFNTLVAAVKAAGLVETLSSEGPFTVFAPNDDAFAKLPEGTVEGLLKDKEKLTEVLTYHVIPGRYPASDVIKMKSAKTLQGREVRIHTAKGFMVGRANIIQPDIMCTNGVCHMIDAVLLPE